MKSIKSKWGTLPKWLKIVILSLLGVFGITAMGFVFGIFIMFLWNKLMPEIFGLKEITYWQAIGLFVLLRILLGSIGGDKSNGSNNKKAMTRNITLSKDKLAVEPDMDDYEMWWQLEGKEAFEHYADSKKI